MNVGRGADEEARRLDELADLDPRLLHRDFLTTWEHPADAIRAVLLVASCLRELHAAGMDARLFSSGMGVSLFRDNSTRTRYSFSAALNLLGLEEYEVEEGSSQMAHGETVRETANMVSFLTEVIGIRDDIYLGMGDAFMREVAQAVEQGFDAGILHQRPSVLNLQSDVDHPTQAIADLAHLAAHFGGLERLRGRKVAVSWAYSPSYGKPLSVPQGVIGLVSRFGADLVLAHPPGYDLIPEVVDRAREQAASSGGTFAVVSGMAEAFRDAEVVYPKSWASWHVMKRRTELKSGGGARELEELERECLQENARYQDWECTRELMNGTRDALYMHCLPADITGVSCEQGEVSREVFGRFTTQTYRQASWKPFVIGAIVVLTRVRSPVLALQHLWQRKERRP